MKKIAILWAMFCIISTQIFTDENYSEVDKCYFPWQLYNYYAGNNSSNILLKYSFENNGININFLVDTRDISFLDYIYSVNGEFVYNLVKYFYFQYQIVKFLDNLSGGPERRQREQQESDRRYNLLHPAEPPR